MAFRLTVRSYDQFSSPRNCANGWRGCSSHAPMRFRATPAKPKPPTRTSSPSGKTPTPIFPSSSLRRPNTQNYSRSLLKFCDQVLPAPGKWGSRPFDRPGPRRNSCGCYTCGGKKIVPALQTWDLISLFNNSIPTAPTKVQRPRPLLIFRGFLCTVDDEHVKRFQLKP